MALLRSHLGAAVLAFALLVAAPAARSEEGEISFCNEFPHTLYIAIAYEEYENNYLSRGWLEVETGKCYVFDTAIRVRSFYFRAESEPYRDGKHKVKMEWGSDKKFAVREANFQSYNAEKAYSGMRLAGFAKGAESSGGPLTAIVTFTATGGSNITVPAPEKSTSGGAGAAAPPPAREASPSASSAAGGIEDKSEAGNSAGDNSPPSATGGNGRDSGPRQ